MAKKQRSAEPKKSVLRDVKEVLHHDFRVIHTTIQFEHAECEVAHGCVIPVGEGEHPHHH